ncbi:uncharacterized protein BT62DRAFT_999427 [Guyanagaster necrorhizus]|uniref:Uncharacterized protein n=1 Tax=Guyanagaster necrorhizus TaxID=856835 RepID=A0A9P8AXL8_9AGAR|nr:uncharacterized protein BT62DRAFT_999427 [Guyanagaster necrorhizus MCA 3950]KAG7451743.1 hypothetical protein BT62DRAFT_999427 [Guyanagaster necrorhizus MCA 3950]
MGTLFSVLCVFRDPLGLGPSVAAVFWLVDLVVGAGNPCLRGFLGTLRRVRRGLFFGKFGPWRLLEGGASVGPEPFGAPFCTGLVLMELFRAVLSVVLAVDNGELAVCRGRGGGSLPRREPGVLGPGDIPTTAVTTSWYHVDFCALTSFFADYSPTETTHEATVGKKTLYAVLKPSTDFGKFPKAVLRWGWNSALHQFERELPQRVPYVVIQRYIYLDPVIVSRNAYPLAASPNFRKVEWALMDDAVISHGSLCCFDSVYQKTCSRNDGLWNRRSSDFYDTVNLSGIPLKKPAPRISRKKAEAPRRPNKSEWVHDEVTVKEGDTCTDKPRPIDALNEEGPHGKVAVAGDKRSTWRSRIVDVRYSSYDIRLKPRGLFIGFLTLRGIIRLLVRYTANILEKPIPGQAGKATPPSPNFPGNAFRRTLNVLHVKSEARFVPSSADFHPTILNASTSGVLSTTPSTDIRILSCTQSHDESSKECHIIQQAGTLTYQNARIQCIQTLVCPTSYNRCVVPSRDPPSVPLRGTYPQRLRTVVSARPTRWVPTHLAVFVLHQLRRHYDPTPGIHFD